MSNSVMARLEAEDREADRLFTAGGTDTDQTAPEQTTATEEHSETQDAEERVRKAEAKWNTANGMLRRQSLDLKEANALAANLKGRNSELEEEIGKLKASFDEFRQQRQQEEEKKKYELSPEKLAALREKMTEDEIEATRELAAATTGPLVDGLRKEIETLRQELKAARDLADSAASTGNKSVHTLFITHMRNAVSDFDKINNDQGFKAFIDRPLYEGGTETRRSIILRAQKENNPGAAARIYNEYAGLVKKTEESVPKRDVYNDVTPSASVSTKVAGSKKIWTMDEVNRAYAMMKRYSPEEQNKIEREIDIALAEGRIR